MKVIIIGGGVAGLSIGWELAGAGAEVMLFERSEPGHGATWAAAGMLAVAGELGSAQTPEADMAREAQRLWPAFAQELEAASGVPVDYLRNGALLVAMNAQAHKALSARMADDKTVEWIDAAQAQALEPMLAPGIAGAYFARNEAQVDPRKLLTALREAFVQAGGAARTGEEVLSIEKEHDHVVAVRTASGLHSADAFVLAAGAWSGLLETQIPVRPIKGELLSLAPPAGSNIPAHVVWGDGVYVVPRGDRLIVGSTMEDVGFNTQATKAAEEHLFTRAGDLMPALRDWKIADHWAGLRPRAPDALPVLGRTKFSNLFAATGQFRNGILFAPYIADLLCRFVLEQPASAPHFDPCRFA